MNNNNNNNSSKKGWITIHKREFLCYAKTGDLLLFSGDSFGSKFTSLFTESPWTHVAFVVKMPNNGEVALFESVKNPDGIFDIISKERESCGVRLIHANKKLENYKGAMCVWKKYDGHPIHADAINRTIEKYHGRPYESSISEMVRSSFFCLLQNKIEANDNIFCSELVALVMKDLGIIKRANSNNNQRRTSNSYTPSDFDCGLEDLICYKKDKLSLIEPLRGRHTLVPCLEPLWSCYCFYCCCSY